MSRYKSSTLSTVLSLPSTAALSFSPNLSFFYCFSTPIRFVTLQRLFLYFLDYTDTTKINLSKILFWNSCRVEILDFRWNVFFMAKLLKPDTQQVLLNYAVYDYMRFPQFRTPIYFKIICSLNCYSIKPHISFHLFMEINWNSICLQFIGQRRFFLLEWS